ncbi:hypothetical protein Calhy_0341 [Caldicellulosiruptor hydrothermalis 108]|uniref:Uncharacterized protein n=1 Tax=Caldicellulosiruptor hydrothermalis (strain DSM 18901 / VKM B-2411 / 108) TaxID=632292 RepID=E4QBI7_CALH1|nr:hypothetical protein Calhy_0341 [Caldicellulosiruptor hydrothermalis 108]
MVGVIRSLHNTVCPVPFVQTLLKTAQGFYVFLEVCQKSLQGGINMRVLISVEKLAEKIRPFLPEGIDVDITIRTDENTWEDYAAFTFVADPRDEKVLANFIKTTLSGLDENDAMLLNTYFWDKTKKQTHELSIPKLSPLICKAFGRNKLSDCLPFYEDKLLLVFDE